MLMLTLDLLLLLLHTFWHTFLGPVDDEVLVGLPEAQSLNTAIDSDSSFSSDIELSG